MGAPESIDQQQQQQVELQSQLEALQQQQQQEQQELEAEPQKLQEQMQNEDQQKEQAETSSSSSELQLQLQQIQQQMLQQENNIQMIYAELQQQIQNQALQLQQHNQKITQQSKTQQRLAQTLPAQGRPLLAQGKSDQGVTDLSDELAAQVKEVTTKEKDLRAKVETLSNRLDAWAQSSPPVLRRRQKKSDEDLVSIAEERSPSPQAAAAPAVHSSAEPGPTEPRTLPRPLGQPTDGARSKPASTHDHCNQPTNPRALAMSQSLGRLPKLRGGGGPLGH